MKANTTAIIIGGGIGGLGTACLLAKAGYRVRLYEKNEQLGGRASVFEANGFRFDMGPSWYLMPDIFTHFFALLGEKIEDHLHLIKLDPSYRLFFAGRSEPVDLSANLEQNIKLFEALEPGSGDVLRQYLDTAATQYRLAMDKILYKNSDSWRDFLRWDLFKEARKLNVFQSMDRYVSSRFRSEEVRKILQYSLVFLGSSPYNTPALYNLMSHIDFKMGVFYPQGGIYTLIEALARIGTKYGATFSVQTPIRRILVENRRTVGVELANGTIDRADLVISNADPYFTEHALLEKPYRDHTEHYWQTRTLAPSAFILYLGMDRKIPSLTHHNLILCRDWKQHFAEIFETPRFPKDPSYYVCAPSITDPTVAPPGKENLFILVPIAAGLETNSEILRAYRDKMIASLTKTTGLPHLEQSIVFERLFCIEDFKERYHSLGGSALGLAHTLRQTALLRPKNVSKKVKNLYFVGGSTTPGIGMPMCLISAELIYKRLIQDRSDEPLMHL